MIWQFRFLGLPNVWSRAAKTACFVERKFKTIKRKSNFSKILQWRQVLYQRVGNLFAVIDSNLAFLSSSLPKTRKSNPLSKLVRPWFEHKHLRGIVGVNLFAWLLFVGVVGSPVAAEFPSGSTDSHEVEISMLEAPDAVVATERKYQMPVELIGVSQGFHRYHPAVDLRAPLGSEIRPIAGGVVVDVLRSRWGYGQAIFIEHADGYSSMYAHVGRIFVEPGSNVDQDSVIAEVGMTGHTTGPHLHLEIYKDGKVVNPSSYLGY
jgi:murein DD-endopeptidase MepM/ murein hydrolase activator NlpD